MTWLDWALSAVLGTLAYVVFVRQWPHMTRRWCGGQNTGNCWRCRDAAARFTDDAGLPWQLDDDLRLEKLDHRDW